MRRGAGALRRERAQCAHWSLIRRGRLEALRQTCIQCAHCLQVRRVARDEIGPDVHIECGSVAPRRGPATEPRGVCAARREKRGKCADSATGWPPMCTLAQVPSRRSAHYPRIRRTPRAPRDGSGPNVHIGCGTVAAGWWRCDGSASNVHIGEQSVAPPQRAREGSGPNVHTGPELVAHPSGALRQKRAQCAHWPRTRSGPPGFHDGWSPDVHIAASPVAARRSFATSSREAKKRPPAHLFAQMSEGALVNGVGPLAAA